MKVFILNLPWLIHAPIKNILDCAIFLHCVIFKQKAFITILGVQKFNVKVLGEDLHRTSKIVSVAAVSLMEGVKQSNGIPEALL